MPSDVRDFLERASGDVDERLDMGTVHRRATVIRRTRAARAALLTLVGVVLVFLAITRFDFPGSDTLPPVRRPVSPVIKLDVGELAVGKHRTGGFAVPFRISIDGGGWAANNTFRNWVMLTHENVAIHFQLWDRVFDPKVGRVDEIDVKDLPDDLARWIASHPRLDVVARDELSLDGRTAMQLDVTVSEPVQPGSIECGEVRCALLGRVKGTGEPVNIETWAVARFIVLPVEADQLVIHYRAEEGAFEDASATFDDLLSTIRFDDS